MQSYGSKEKLNPILLQATNEAPKILDLSILISMRRGTCTVDRTDCEVSKVFEIRRKA
jgi:hypothetical protein